MSIRIALWVWLIAAVLLGNSGALQRVPLPALHGIIVALTVLILVLYLRVGTLRNWIDRLDLRALVFLHCARFVGIYFLVLHQRGLLPRDFAVPAGWGDAAVALLALAVCFVPMNPPTRVRAIRIWNIVGFIDILFVLFTATRLGQQDDVLMRPLTNLPLSLLPTFLVPLLIATHIIIYLRLQRESAPR